MAAEDSSAGNGRGAGRAHVVHPAGKAPSRAQPRIRVARIRPCGIARGDSAAEPGDRLLSPWLPRAVIGRRGIPPPRAVLTTAAGPNRRMGLQPLHPAWLELADRAACLIGAGRVTRELGWVPEYDAVTTCREPATRMRSGPPGPSPPLDPARPPFRPGQPTRQDQRPQCSGAAESTGGQSAGSGGDATGGVPG